MTVKGRVPIWCLDGAYCRVLLLVTPQVILVPTQTSLSLEPLLGDVLYTEYAQGGHGEAAGGSDRAGGLHLCTREGPAERGGGVQG